MGKTPKRHSAEFKFKVVLESIQRNQVAEVARHYSVHPNQLTKWRQELLQRGPSLFEPREGKEAEQYCKRIAQLEGLIGKKEIELSVLKNYLDFYVPPDGR
jgi:transposase-like protein